ncbi:VWA domain-containing protein [Frateuria sp. MAH-13]|uniref:VWA domain-containing protein n=1 Tax=Frateuria flava TaxID=2821489 RepID=A0ABS4DRM1_9GAMM|nr:VWA domain-containing protein [Frateuria flava]MBP1475701.1 VWA domain-containing protein [Frateuria flava]
MNALRSLLLALFVLLVGCTASKPPARQPAAKGPPLSTVQPAPLPPPPPPMAKPGATADRVLREAAPAPPAMQVMAQAAAPNALYAASLPSWVAPPVDTERYTHHEDNPVQLASEQPVSTFGIDVDTGAYANVRRMLNEGALPPADAVRAEEFINYFDYGYMPPADRAQPFSVTTELAPAPWNAKRQLLLIGIQGYRVPAAQIPAANLVFLIDTSGSMDEPDKLPLLKASLRQLVRQLRRQDRVAIVTYAGSAGVALPSTPGDRHATIEGAIDALGASGSTNGGAGIDLAYAQAEQGFIEGGVNRVILATDGDFNVGTVDEQTLRTRIEDHRKSGIALTTLGFGQGNYNDAMAVMLADVGNGSHHYIDSLQEGRRVLVQEMSATLLTIASDVKIQVEFNPAQVKEYRLIGYEKRVLRREDFNNDKVDAGEIGAGANVTALYEIVPQGSDGGRIDPLRYGEAKVAGTHGNELALLRLRYKLPGQSHSRLIERPIAAQTSARASERLRFAAAVAAFADQLRGGKGTGDFGYRRIAALANAARGRDPDGYRAGFVQLVGLADGLATHAPDGNASTAAR